MNACGGRRLFNIISTGCLESKNENEKKTQKKEEKNYVTYIQTPQSNRKKKCWETVCEIGVVIWNRIDWMPNIGKK